MGMMVEMPIFGVVRVNIIQIYIHDGEMSI